MNDGVGHCSMEIGNYIYQWQPNFIGTYFYHCHRNTMQHFEFGLFGTCSIDPPGRLFCLHCHDQPARRHVVLNNIPIGAGRDGKFRTAANLVTPVGGLYRPVPGFRRRRPRQRGLRCRTPCGSFPRTPMPLPSPTTWRPSGCWMTGTPSGASWRRTPSPSFPGTATFPGSTTNSRPGSSTTSTPITGSSPGVPVPGPPGSTVAINPAGAAARAGAAWPGGVIPPQLNSGVSRNPDRHQRQGGPDHPDPDPGCGLQQRQDHLPGGRGDHRD